jgi:hypothetical protein
MSNDDALFEQSMRNLRDAARIAEGRDRPDRHDIAESCRWAESRLRHYRDRDANGALSTPALAALRARLLDRRTMPRRQEAIGGQTFDYVQLDEVIGHIDALLTTTGGVAPAPPDDLVAVVRDVVKVWTDNTTWNKRMAAIKRLAAFPLPEVTR